MRKLSLPDLLTPAEVSLLFKVDPKTVTRWADAGLLPSFRTPGGHRRFHAADIQAFFDSQQNGKRRAARGGKP